MKKILGFFAALAVMFLMSADVYSSSKGTKTGERSVMYCVYNNWGGYCFKHITGTACYLVDENCNWIDDQTPPEN